MRTLKELAKEALDVQDAVNLSGVAQSFAKMILDLRRPGLDSTDGINKHPIVTMWLDKMNSLNGYQSERPEAFVKAYQAVQKILEE